MSETQTPYATVDPQHVYLSLNEAAAVLRVSRSTVRDMVLRGDLACVRCGSDYRIPRTAVLPEQPVGLSADEVEALLHTMVTQAAAAAAERAVSATLARLGAVLKGEAE
jgi:excisionase family DNA binding protein